MRASKTGIVSILALGLLASSAVGTAASARNDGGCPKGAGWERVEAFDLQTETFLIDNITAYGSVERALADNIYTETELEAQFANSDRNTGNGFVCIKDVYEFSNAPARSQGFYYYVSVVDDNAPARD